MFWSDGVASVRVRLVSASAVGMLQRFVGYRAVARSDDGAICGWKMDGGTELHKLGSVDGHKGGVSALASLGGKPSSIKTIGLDMPVDAAMCVHICVDICVDVYARQGRVS